MQLCYRGTRYQAETKAINPIESEKTGRFLGQIYTIRQTNYRSPLHSDIYKYRGIVYQK